MVADIEDLENLMEQEPKDKKAEVHRNLKIGFTILGFVVLGMTAVINYYTIKKLSK